METWTWTIAATLVSILLYLKWRGQRRRLPPGPLGLPLLGYLPWLDPKKPHLSLTRLARKHGRICSLQMGSIFTVVLSDVKLIREAFSLESFSGRAPLYLTHGVMDGNGIICVQGDKWKDQRKFAITHLKNLGMVKFGTKRDKMESEIKKGVQEMVTKLQETKLHDTEHLLMHNLGNVVFNLVFGKRWNENDPIWIRLQKYQEEGTKLIGIAGPINFLPFLRVLPKYKNIIKYIKNGIIDTHIIYQNILKEYRNSIKEEEKGDHLMAAFEEEMKKGKKENGFYNERQFNFLMADLWGAGVDTTMTTLRWFFLYLAVHSEIQEKIQKEIDGVLGEKELSLSDASDLPLLQASIAEVQRIRSVTPLGIPHGTLEEVELGGYLIPKGTMVIPLQWAIHMNPEIFPNPERFDPYRFIQQDGKFFKPESFIPFQTGKRMCLGEEYARMLLQLFAGIILQKFKLSLENEQQIDLEGQVGITLTPKPHKIKFVVRKVN